MTQGLGSIQKYVKSQSPPWFPSWFVKLVCGAVTKFEICKTLWVMTDRKYLVSLNTQIYITFFSVQIFQSSSNTIEI